MTEECSFERMPVAPDSPWATALLTLYREAFPESERIPEDELFALAAQDRCELSAYVVDDGLVAMSFLVHDGDLVYLFYLAVAASARGRGYGSAVLRRIGESNSGCRIVLEIETLGGGVPDTDIRSARKRFYERNGLAATGIVVREGIDIYDIMCTDIDFDIDELMRLLATLGPSMDDCEVLCNPRIPRGRGADAL